MKTVEHSQLQFSLTLFPGTPFASIWLQSHHEALLTKQEMRTDNKQQLSSNCYFGNFMAKLVLLPMYFVVFLQCRMDHQLASASTMQLTSPSQIIPYHSVVKIIYYGLSCYRHSGFQQSAVYIKYLDTYLLNVIHCFVTV